MDMIKDDLIRESGLLLHACCGPCAEYPIEDYRIRGIRPILYYANPNIHPEAEWQKRFEALEYLARIRQLDLHYSPLYGEQVWRAYRGRGKPCMLCYRLRMEEAAKKARDLALGFFTSTLLISPYQKHEAIQQAGRAAGQKYGVEWLGEDWRKFFREGQRMAREDGLYRQKYCGCLYSLRESDFREKAEKGHAEFEALPATPEPQAMK